MHNLYNPVFQTEDNCMDPLFFIIFYCRQSGGSQNRLRFLEKMRKVTARRKLDAIKSLKSENHKYLSFFVCRNPVEKLLSVYNFMLYQTRIKKKIFEKFPRKNPPTWEQYIHLVATRDRARDLNGLSGGVVEKCSPCHYNFDAVIKMESFNKDSR